MSKLYLRQMSLIDALVVIAAAEPDDMNQARAFGFDGDDEQLAAFLFGSNGPKWTIASGSTHSALAVGGFSRRRQGVYESWFLAHPDLWAYAAKEATKMVRDTIRNMLQDGAHRIETVSLSNRAQAHRWYEAIGLTREAEHPGFGVSGQAAVTYVRIR